MCNVWVLCVHDLQEALSAAGDRCECIHFHACVSCAHQLDIIHDGSRSLAAWRQTDSTAVPPIYDGHNRWTHTYRKPHSKIQNCLVHVFLKCSFGSTKDTADVIGHGLCTNYVWDSCDCRGSCQQSNHLLPKEGNNLQHQQAGLVKNRSRVCARNGLAVRKRHLWIKMDAHLTNSSLCQNIRKCYNVSLRDRRLTIFLRKILTKDGVCSSPA